MKYVTFTRDLVVYGVPVHVVAKLYAHSKASLEPHTLYHSVFRVEHSYGMRHPEKLVEFIEDDKVPYESIAQHITLLDDMDDKVQWSWKGGPWYVEDLAWVQN